MRFPDALRMVLDQGGFATRPVWAAGWDVFLFTPPPGALRLNRPCLLSRDPGGAVEPWTPAHEDLMANDWQVAFP